MTAPPFFCHQIRRWAMLVVIFLPLSLSSQPPVLLSRPVPASLVKEMYEACRAVRPDTVTRIYNGYLNQYQIRKNRDAFYEVYTLFRKKCLEEQQLSLYHRLQVIELQSRLRFDNADGDLADNAFESLFDELVSQHDYGAALECLFELAQFQHRLKSNVQSLKVLLFAEKFAERYGLTGQIAFQALTHRIGYILWDMDKPALSIPYFKRSLATGNGILMDSLVALNGLGINYQKLDSLETSLTYFREASRLAMNNHNEIFNAVVLGCASLTYQKLGKSDSAYNYGLQYANMSLRDSLWENAVDAYSRLIRIELERKNQEHAHRLLDTLTALMPHIRATDMISFKRYEDVRYRYLEQQGRYQEALQAYKQFVHYDSLFQEYGNKNRISELELNAEARLYDQEMIAKEKARKFRSLVESIVLGVIVIAATGLIVYGHKKIQHIQASRRATETINRQQAAEISTLRQQLLAQLALIRDTNANYQQAIADQSARVSMASVREEEHQSNVEQPVVAADLQALKEFDLTQKEHWKAFKELFHTVYPGFETGIRQKMGMVSSAELRLMMLQKLGLNNKEIAQTLMISPESVKKGKYRLYKKIGINSAAALDRFLS